MGDERYYRDAPSFERRDTLWTWTVVFMIASGAALLWVLLLFWLMATRRLDAAADTALGLSQTAWVILSTLVLFACLIGLTFVVVARVNRRRSEAYLDAMAARGETGEESPRARLTRAPSRATAVDETAAPAGGGAVQVAAVRPAARIESTMGPDGRTLLSYTVPPEQPRGLYADTYVPVDSDAILNVKTLLAKTPGAR